MPSPLDRAAVLDELRLRLVAHGLNVVGGVDGREFDRTQPCGRRVQELAPGCGTILVAGDGGSEFWRRMQALPGGASLRGAAWSRAVAAWSEAVCADALRWLRARGLHARVVYPGGKRPLNFVQLAEMAGLGTVSPVSGWLLHPEYGPWVSFRFALILDEVVDVASLPRVASGDFQPCTGCDQRCVRACPVQVCDGFGTFAFDRCAAHRHAGGCSSGCAMRQACPCGAEHRQAPDEDAARHAAALRGLERDYGSGWWQRMPRWVRGR